MKKSIFFLLLTVAAVLTGCKDDAVEVNPLVSLSAVAETASTLTFTVTPENADACAYVCVESTNEIPDGAAILANGTAVDAKNMSTQTVSGLQGSTTYTIVAAVKAGSVIKVSNSLQMTTQEGPSVFLQNEGGVTATSVNFSIEPQRAEACAYVCIEAGATVPTAEEIIANGQSVDADKKTVHTVEGLEPFTEYLIVGAVQSKNLYNTHSITAHTLYAPTINVFAGEVTGSSISFTVSPGSAIECAYLVRSNNTVPTVADVFAQGTTVPANENTEITVEGLDQQTAYTVYAAVKNGAFEVLSDPVVMTTDIDEDVEDVTITAKFVNKRNYQFYVSAEGAEAVLDIYCPTSIYNVLPEGEYIVDIEANSWSGSEISDYYIGENSNLQMNNRKLDIVSGKMVVKHLEAGYDVYVSVKDKEGNQLKGKFAGIVEPKGQTEFNNPPIPWNDVTIETALTSVTGTHDAPLGADGWYELYITTAEGSYDIHLMIQSPVAYDGVLPAGEYFFNSQAGEYTIYYGGMALQGGEEVEFTDAYLKVEHLDRGYQLTLHVEDMFKTKIDATWSGMITKTENCMYYFENPGYEYPEDYSVEFTSAQIKGLDGSGGRYVTFRNELGDVITVALNENKVSSTEITPGFYTSVPWWDGSDAFTYYGNNTTLTMVNVPNPYPFYPSGGYIEVTKEGDIYTVKMNVYIYKDGQKLFRSVYVGAIE